MQILLLLTDLFDAIGGIQTFNRCFVKALDDLSANHNINVKVLVLNDTGSSKLTNKYISSGNVTYIYCSKNRFKFFIEVLKLSIKSDKVILGHVNFSPMAIFVNLLNPKIKKYLIVHGVEVWKKLSLFKLEGSKKINQILHVSAYTKEQMKKNNNINEREFSVFPNTLDPFYPIKLSEQEKIIFPNGKIILSVTRLDSSEYYKNIGLMIKALPEVLKSIPDACYVIVGEGTDRFRLELLAKELGIRDNVIFTGYVPDNLLHLYYEASDIFVLPSEKEGFGIVFLEAMYFSKPCIGANAGGIPEVIEDGKTGVLIDPKNINSLSENIIKLLKDKDLCSSIGKAGKERFEKEFSFEAFKERLEEVIIR